jgi:hypothetical protein
MTAAKEFPRASRTDSPPLSEKMQQALASLALEGIELPPESLEDIQKLDAGEMSKEEYLKRVIERAKS